MSQCDGQPHAEECAALVVAVVSESASGLGNHSGKLRVHRDVRELLGDFAYASELLVHVVRPTVSAIRDKTSEYMAYGA